MLDLRNRNQDAWPEALRPLGDGGFETEGFEAWSDRNRALIDHLHPQIAEQWPYRHYSSTRYRFLDLREMKWREEVWTTADFMASVHLEFGGPAVPDHDYEVFQKGGGWGPLPTARGWLNGSWDVPVVILETPYGVRSYDGDLPNARFLIIEGSKRYRYLNALIHRGEDTGPHSVFVLASPQVEAEH
jgi:hypothetical protein